MDVYRLKAHFEANLGDVNMLVSTIITTTVKEVRDCKSRSTANNVEPRMFKS